jgi:hypothetical protein
MILYKKPGILNFWDYSYELKNHPSYLEGFGAGF